MITYTRFRLQRTMRRYQRTLARSWGSAGRYIHFNIIGKWRQLAMIRRFTLGWWIIIAVCAVGLVLQIRTVASEGMVLQAVPGGTYSEAIVGTVKNINPILPEGSAGADAVRLVFSGLTRFDTQGNLEPDIASSWTVSPDGKTYTFKLRKGVTWHDGVPLTAQDVLFTLTAIQNPDTRSPLAASWQGVKATAPDDHTVVFTLPKPYTPFINATNVGLLPRHLLENTEPSQLRFSQFNQNPVGTGPFKMQRFDPGDGSINLKANPAYYFGRPLIDGFDIRLYDSDEKAFDAYSHRQVLGVADLQADEVAKARKLGTMKLYEATVPEEAIAFFQMSNPALSDKNVRGALALATNRQAIIDNALGGQATALTSPLFGPRLNLAGAPHQPNFNLTKARTQLDAAGWKLGSDGVRTKGNLRLELELVTQAGTEYGAVAKQLAEQWGQVGAKLKIQEVDAMRLQQSYIRTRHYDVLLYGINVGADPDVYAFWDSSQAKDPGLNLSGYSSSAADKALETGRTISDPTLRAAKYRAFVQAFVADTPAVMLYTPTYIYGVDASVHGINLRRLIYPSDRFNDVEKWSVRVRAVPAQ